MSEVVDSFKASVIRALEQDRYDDLVLLLANQLRRRQQVVSVHARSALPVNADICQPLPTGRLSQEQIDTFGFRDEGWYIIAVEDCAIISAECFPYTVDDPGFRTHIQRYLRGLSRRHTDLPDVFATYHLRGLLLEFQHLFEFRPT
ncbi:hypothetical protein [Roseovarius sp. M141]|uniref:hypothetical protein n=1 Tax=Roseovarius sp. M141 TaxID=2583806 RepID=UPI0020CFDC2C|nr:hypothetical protein [Roseovarius sp. M141]MCQ0090632.1 hypothetical protein [Roseovarius sp. M141]